MSNQYTLTIPDEILKAIAIRRGWKDQEPDGYKLIARDAIIKFMQDEFKACVSSDAQVAIQVEVDKQNALQLEKLAGLTIE